MEYQKYSPDWACLREPEHWDVPHETDLACLKCPVPEDCNHNDPRCTQHPPHARGMKRAVKVLTIDGEKYSYWEAYQKWGVKPETIRERRKRGMSDKEAATSMRGIRR